MPTHNKMTLRVDFLASTDIREAISQAKSMASTLSVAFVEFNFNGVTLSISEKADLDICVKKFNQALQQELKYVVY